MPLYEYECEAENGRRFEIIQKFSDEPLTVCPTCGGAVRRLISSPAIQFKGSGWYITDYAKKSGSDASRESKASAPSSDTSSSGSSPSSSTPAASTSTTPAKKD
jgi:putative FmdB family regulatory protein